MSKLTKPSENTSVFVNGNITSSTLLKRKTFEENGRIKATYNSIVLHNAKVVERNPGKVSVEELFAHYKFFPSRIGGFGIIAVNATPEKTIVYAPNDKGGTSEYKKINLTSELSKGTNVTIELRTENNSFVLTNVFINEKISA